MCRREVTRTKVTGRRTAEVVVAAVENSPAPAGRGFRVLGMHAFVVCLERERSHTGH